MPTVKELKDELKLLKRTHKDIRISGLTKKQLEELISKYKTPKVPTPKAPTPKAPTPKVPTPKAPTPKINMGSFLNMINKLSELYKNDKINVDLTTEHFGNKKTYKVTDKQLANKYAKDETYNISIEYIDKDKSDLDFQVNLHSGYFRAIMKANNTLSDITLLNKIINLNDELEDRTYIIPKAPTPKVPTPKAPTPKKSKTPKYDEDDEYINRKEELKREYDENNTISKREYRISFEKIHNIAKEVAVKTGEEIALQSWYPHFIKYINKHYSKDMAEHIKSSWNNYIEPYEYIDLNY
jgi:hypothetical protein